MLIILSREDDTKRGILKFEGEKGKVNMDGLYLIIQTLPLKF